MHTEFQGLPPPPAAPLPPPIHYHSFACDVRNSWHRPPYTIIVLPVMFGTPGNLTGPDSGLLGQQVRHVSLFFVSSLLF